VLSITLTDNRQISRHTGESIPYNLAEQTLQVQADGDELMFINARMPGLPQRIGRSVQRWFGDDAKFIVGNW